ncbi:MAG: ATP-binding protein [Bacteroidales bacterium]|nr:ATP-binding protein [Bacteroidales bacterium]
MFVAEKKIQFQDFPVIKDYGNEEDFFRIQTPNGEIHLKKLPFQKNAPLPDTLSCRLKGFNGPNLVLGHNMPRYVSEFYADGFSKGQEFEFKVVSRPNDNHGFYRLEDQNGLQFKLQEQKTQFAIGQSVKCKFEFLDPTVYILRRSDADSQLKMFTMRDIARVINIKGWAVEKLDRQVREIPEFAKAIEELDNGQPSWIFTALRASRSLIPRWFTQSMASMPYEQVRNVLQGARTVSLHLLEGSAFLRNIKGPERANMQGELTSQIELIDNYIKALEIINQKGQKDFINDLLEHLKESGYIYHPNTQFAILMILFRQSPELVNTSLGNLFDALMEWYPDTWKAEPFRQAFVEQLEYYIAETREEIDLFLIPETGPDNERIEKVLTAIAIQQALATENDNIDLRLNLSLFYRCLSLLRSTKADTLLHKSYLTLMGVKLPTDFNWNDIKEPTMMMTRAAVDPPKNAVVPQSSRYFISDKVEVEVSDEGISIARTDEDAIGQVPNGMLPWPGLQVNVNLEHALTRAKMKTLEGHTDFWSEVETALFQPKAVAEQYTSAKRMPDIDDTVRIEIDRVIYSPYDQNRVEAFHCKIVDDHFFEGDGIMLAEDLVSYNLHGVTVGAFRNDNGEPLHFDALVKDIDQNDRLRFSLIDTVRMSIRDLTYSGDKCHAVVTKDNGRSYSAISDKGFGLFIKKDLHEKMPFHCGNVLLVTITNFDKGTVQSVVEEGPLDGVVLNNAKSLQNLLRAIAIKEEEDIQDMELDDEDLIPREDLREIIQVLRYKAVSKSDDIIQAFDYLSYARLLARTIGDTELAAALKAHRDILLLHQHYAKNKTIYREDINKVVAEVPQNNQLIRRMASRLMIVTSLGMVDDNSILWDIANNSDNETERELAQMVLSYNLLFNINHDDATAANIKDKIAKTLNVSSEQRSLKYYGSENQYVEFKSSIVYPAQKGNSGISMADPDKQEFEILHIIAGFLNTTGGTLYIGVNDDHYERGLEEDFKFYKLDQSERNNPRRRSIKSLDNLTNYLQNLIDRAFSLGTNAGDYAKAYIDDESTKGVVMVKVDPCPRVVYLDNTIFVRHSAKTTPLTEKTEIEQFIADRTRLFTQQQANVNAALPTNMPAPAVPQTKTQPTKSQTEAVPEVKANESGLFTSLLRKNILHDYIDPEHFVPASFYIRFVGDHEYMITTDEWSLEEDNDRLDLIVKNDETDAFLVLIYEGEYALKVPMRELQQKKKNVPHTHYNDRKLIFACPMRAEDGLYSIHTNSKGTVYERFTPVEAIAQASMGSAPVRLMEAECADTPMWEAVPTNRVHEFDHIKSSTLKRTQLGSLAKGIATSKVSVDDAINLFYGKF